MKTILHKSNERGTANLGWLKSYHSFSFSRYYDPNKMSFGLLRVLNDDTVSAGMGFGTHSHDNMEIISIPLEGELRHNDSTGREAVIKTHDVQIMSAGSGIAHSEMNNSRVNEVKFLQLWIIPKEVNITPRYEQKTYLPVDREQQFKLIVSPEGGDALWINQDAYISIGRFKKDTKEQYTIRKTGNGVYFFVLNGEIEIANNKLTDRDAIGIYNTSSFEFTTKTDSEILIIEVPMN